MCVCVWDGGRGGERRSEHYICLHVSVSASRAKNYRPNYPTDADEIEKGVLFVGSLIWVCNICSKRDVPIFIICNVPSSCMLVFWGVRILPFLTCYSSRHVTLKTGLSLTLSLSLSLSLSVSATRPIFRLSLSASVSFSPAFTIHKWMSYLFLFF